MDDEALLKEVYRKMLEAMTPIEPEFMEAVYSGRGALYMTFEDDKLKFEVVDIFEKP